MQAVKIRVRGKVQGVFFRASTKEQAQNLGITGWCKNEKDGSVLIWAQGSLAELTAFAEWCRKGPDMAIVKSIEKEGVTLQDFNSFEIRH